MYLFESVDRTVLYQKLRQTMPQRIEPGEDLDHELLKVYQVTKRVRYVLVERTGRSSRSAAIAGGWDRERVCRLLEST